MKRSKAFLGAFLAVTLIGSSLMSSVAIAAETGSSGTGTATAANSSASTNSSGSPVSAGAKQEVVYANLTSGGSVSDVYVVNEFNQSSSGTITDYGNYSAVSNLTNTNEIKQEGEKVSVSADPGEFYYQGTLSSTNLPWNYSLSFMLDGKSITAQDLAGKSGKLEIKLSSTKNNTVDSAFYDNYMQQVSLTLDTSVADNIASDGATIANSGKSKVITHTVMPGKDAAISIKADVHDFSMDGFQIAAMPFSMGMDLSGTTDGLLDQMTPLTDAVSQLNDGMAKIAEGNKGLADGAAQLNSGSADFGAGLNQLSANSASLVEGSAQIQSALATISAAMGNSGSGFNPDDFKQLPAALNQMSQGLALMADGLSQVNAGYGPAYSGLDQAMQGLAQMPVPDTSSLAAIVDQEQDPALKGQALAELGYIANYGQTVQAVVGTYNMVKPAFDGVAQALPPLVDQTSNTSLYALSAGLSTMATEIQNALDTMDLSGLQKLAEGLSQLSSNYDTFQNGLVAYTGGVTSAAQGYSQLQQGITSLSSGTAQLSDGTAQLAQGTSQLNDGVATLPEEMQVQIDSLMGDFDKSDFKPVSFVSPKNSNVSLVQFVITTDGVTAPDAPSPIVEESDSPSIWDRFLGLFS